MAAGPAACVPERRGRFAQPLMEEDQCPLCMEDMDVTDRNFRPCKCGYQICLFCYRHIKDDLNGLCPACRTPYDEANVSFVTPDPQEMARMAREKKAKELKDKKEQQAKEAKEKREAELKSRQEAQARAAATAAAASAGVGGSSAVVRAATAPASTAASAAGAGSASCCNGSTAAAAAVAAATARPVVKQPLQAGRQQEQLQRDMALRTSQRAIVYVMGLSPRIAKEEILRRHEYFGQYGKILRIQVSPAGAAATSGPPSLRCCITYATREEAEQAVLAVDNVVLDGRTLKASFGMPKPAAQGPAVRAQLTDARLEFDRRSVPPRAVMRVARSPPPPAASQASSPPSLLSLAPAVLSPLEPIPGSSATLSLSMLRLAEGRHTRTRRNRL